MVKQISLLAISTFLLLLLLNACAPVYCSTPYILSEGACCLDKDKDGSCDQGMVVEEEEYELETTTTTKKEEKKERKQQPKTKEGVFRQISEDDDPYLGNKDADVLFIEFADYASKNTQRFHEEILPYVLEEYGDHIKYVFRNYPDLSNKQSLQAAEASECAKEQNQFWEYHEILIKNSYRLTTSNLRNYANEANLNPEQFELCLSQKKYSEEVLNDRKDGDASRVIVTPTFFINNERISGYKTLPTFQEHFEETLYEELKQQRGTTTIAESTKKAYIILEGPSALDPTVTTSPYSDTIDFIDATFHLEATDVTAEDDPSSQDTATLTATYTLKRPQDFRQDTYKIVLKELLTEGVDHSFYGGVGSNVLINGNTAVGTPYLPPSHAYVTLWGKSDLYKNDELIIENTFTHFMITQAIRDKDNKLVAPSLTEGVEAYLLLSGKYGDEYLPGTEQGFIYLFWNILDLTQ